MHRLDGGAGARPRPSTSSGADRTRRAGRDGADRGPRPESRCRRLRGHEQPRPSFDSRRSC